MSEFQMTADVENIKKMSTFPNRDDGLSAEQVKARFDQAAVDIKRHINEVIAPAIKATKVAADVSVSYSAQELTAGQQEQARNNIGAASADDFGEVVRNCPGMKGIPDATSFNHLTANLDQGFYRVHKNDWADLPGTIEESPLALLVFWYTKYYYVHIAYSMVSNMVAYRIVKADTHAVHKDWFVQTDNVVQYTDQELTDAQQEQARNNIGAASKNDLHLMSDEVRDVSDTVSKKVGFTPQALSVNQKIQARSNIDAASQMSVDYLISKFTTKGISLTDEKTSEKYVLYVQNGKLTMEKE